MIQIYDIFMIVWNKSLLAEKFTTNKGWLHASKLHYIESSIEREGEVINANFWLHASKLFANVNLKKEKMNYYSVWLQIVKRLHHAWLVSQLCFLNIKHVWLGLAGIIEHCFSLIVDRCWPFQWLNLKFPFKFTMMKWLK